MLLQLIDLHDACVIWMCGIIWVVQLLLYPNFRSVPEAEFTLHHAAHSFRISLLVWPMFVELLICVWIMTTPARSFGWVIELLGILLIFGATAFLSIPEHHLLGSGKNLEAIERLIRTNWIRTLTWTLLLAEVLSRRLAASPRSTP
jgi:hypothetical protein